MWWGGLFILYLLVIKHVHAHTSKDTFTATHSLKSLLPAATPSPPERLLAHREPSSIVLPRDG